MPDLVSVIMKYNLTGGASAITKALNAQTIRHDTDGKRETFADMIGSGEFSPEEISYLTKILIDNGMQWVVYSLAGSGIAFADPTFIASLSVLVSRGLIPPAIAKRISEFGIWYVSPWNEEGNVGQVTEEQVAAVLPGVQQAWNAVALKQKFQSRMSAIHSQIVTGSISTWDQVVAELQKQDTTESADALRAEIPADWSLISRNGHIDVVAKGVVLHYQDVQSLEAIKADLAKMPVPTEVTPPVEVTLPVEGAH